MEMNGKEFAQEWNAEEISIEFSDRLIKSSVF